VKHASWQFPVIDICPYYVLTSMTAKTTASRICAVCGLAPGEDCPSALGPTSYPVCETCLAEGAESIGVVCLWVRLQGGPANLEKGDPDGRFRELKSFANGNYIGWPEIIAIYPEYEARVFAQYR
jgi:hypothetical protein